MGGAESRGLTSAQASDRLRTDGPNDLPAPRRRSAIRRFADELTHFFALLLWGAAALSFLAGIPQLGIAVAAVILVNAAFSFIQEERADRAAERLRTLLPASVTVIRDGRRTLVDAALVVVGDRLLLRPGDRIPADATARAPVALEVDASMLTGESEPERVNDGGSIFAGTFVVAGEAEADVTGTGGATRLAAIAGLTATQRRPRTPLALQLRRVVRVIAAIALTVGAVFFAITLLVGGPVDQAAVFAIGVTVALVPEALLPTVTLTLAWGAEQMARRNVLVRHLEAVETLGSTTIICTDKTGTLTRNEMTVVQAWTPQGTATVRVTGYAPVADVDVSLDATPSLLDLAATATRCSDGFVRLDEGHWRPHGDPMEAALDSFARRLGVDTDPLREPVDEVARFPFDPSRRRMSVVDGGQVLVKGAPDAVLDRCIAEDGVAAAREALSGMTGRGLRVLAVARRPSHGAVPTSAADAERDLTLLGLLGLEDPPRADVRESLEACRTAGIAVIMVTGDHPRTAGAIATEVGLREAADPILTGAELPEGDSDLARLIEHTGTVIARVSPEEKLRIARVLRESGHVVAMTGDGVNDVPALEAADIGIAMGESGTDIAREAADLVLLDDHFSSIVAGVEQGRATYANIRRFLTYHLTDNVAELTPFLVWGLSGGSFPLALSVLAIIALDIGTDTLSAVALGAEPPSRHVLHDPPISGRLLNRTVLVRAFGILGPTVALVTMAAFLASYLAAGWRPGMDFPVGQVALAASGAAFMAVVLTQTANAFACRSSVRPPWALGWMTNRLLIPAASIELGFSALAIFVVPFAGALGQAPPDAAGWTIALLGIPALLAVDATAKWLRRRGYSSSRTA